jgi:hypothetical protein
MESGLSPSRKVSIPTSKIRHPGFSCMSWAGPTQSKWPSNLGKAEEGWRVTRPATEKYDGEVSENSPETKAVLGFRVCWQPREVARAEIAGVDNERTSKK